MITETVISVLKNDSTIRTLLDSTTANNTPVSASYALNDVAKKFIVVSMVMGESHETNYENGIVHLEIYIKTIDNNSPLSIINSISKRIVDLLDLKGSQLNDSFSAKVYRLRKTSSEVLWDEASQSHVGTMDFEFYKDR